VMRTTLSSAITYYEETAPRGEYVLILEGEDALPEELKPKQDTWYASLSHEEHVAKYEKDGLSRMDAIKAAAKDLSIPKSELYRELQTK
ncbi:MAG: 16S rRNA (cytidine(1402)-2'-O)-methyltransferase, partial [Paraprevotella sp.]|nr:16S rRNA (cytidine(1402)-2'-O)-methyltransferase [Paraprevotella sp.]